MSDCIFCKIKDKEIPSVPIYEDDKIYVFRDADPQAPEHVLMIPKQHITGLDAVTAEDEPLLGYMLAKVREIAEQLEMTNGYRVVINNGEDGQQTVPHLHIHILGKRKLTWPPG
ncbi:MAG: histidine triad nucleotide-binding protein [Eubacteriales bacterium]|jgi:diadenosine tetraphosphate (Ap4A) HIT family hydrolase|nr:histidine triad nucleotide-binding protein [Eubacteriales bacterium]